MFNVTSVSSEVLLLSEFGVATEEMHAQEWAEFCQAEAEEDAEMQRDETISELEQEMADEYAFDQLSDTEQGIARESSRDAKLLQIIGVDYDDVDDLPF